MGLVQNTLVRFKDGVASLFNELTTPADVKNLKDRAAVIFAPVMKELAKVPADAQGRTFRLYILSEPDVLTGEPEVVATIGHFNDVEEKAFKYFQTSEGSWHADDPTTGTSFSAISSRTYDVTLLAGKANPGRTIYRAMMPPPASDPLQDYHSKFQQTRSFEKIVATLDKFLLQQVVPDQFPAGFRLPEQQGQPAMMLGKVRNADISQNP